jgi:Tfp pilus assembly protein PilF
LALAAGCASSSPTPEVKRLQAQAVHERGLAHWRDGQASLALSALREAVSVDPRSPTYRDSLGLLYLQLGRPDLAIPEFETAVRLDPQHADAVFHLGTAFAEQRQWEAAAAAYRRAIALPRLTTPDLAYQNLGLALYHLKRYGEAEEALRFALHLEPQLQAAHYSLGLVLAAGSRREEARAAFRRARELGIDSPFGRAAVKQLKELGEGG